MKYTVNYGNGTCVLPKSVVDVMKRAGALDLRVLMYLCAQNGEFEAGALCEACGCDDDEMRDALAFWRGAGIIEACGKSEKKSEKKSSVAKEDKADAEKQTKKLRASDELPSYTSDQLGNILEKRQDLVTLIDECQNILGKLLNYKEVNVLIGLVDYLELDLEYVLTLTSYCVSIGKKTLHYIEKTAFGLYDSGICTAEQLSAELERRERAAETEGKIRAMFGIGTRSSTTKEKKFIDAWVNEFGYGQDIIKKAYEVTADATGNASIPYANSVIERWNAEGLRTLEAIEESYRKNEAANKSHEGSFDTDSFFEAAVQRSLGKN